MRRRAHRLRRLPSLVAIPLGAVAVAAVLGQGEAPAWDAVRSRPDPALRPPLDRTPRLGRIPMKAWWQAVGGPHLGEVSVTGAARGPLVDLTIEFRYQLSQLAMPPGAKPDLPATLAEVLAVPYLQHTEVTYAGRGWARLHPLRQGELRMTQKGPPSEGERRRVELHLRALAPRGEDGRREVLLGFGPLPIQHLRAQLDVAGGATPTPSGPWRWRSEDHEGGSRLAVEARRVRGEAVLVATWEDHLEASSAGPEQGLLVEDAGPGAVRWLSADLVRPEDRGVPAAPTEVAPLVAAAQAPAELPRPPMPTLPTLPTTWFSGEDLETQCRARQERLSLAIRNIRRPGGVPPHWPESWEETVAPPPKEGPQGTILRARRARLALPRKRGEWFPLRPLLPWIAAEEVLDFHPSDPGNVRETLDHFLLLGDGHIACLIHGSHASPRTDRKGRSLSARDQLRQVGVTDPAILDAAYDGER